MARRRLAPRRTKLATGSEICAAFMQMDAATKVLVEMEEYVDLFESALKTDKDDPDERARLFCDLRFFRAADVTRVRINTICKLEDLAKDNGHRKVYRCLRKSYVEDFDEWLRNVRAAIREAQ